MFCRLSPSLVLRSPWRPYRARPGERVLVLRTSSTFPPAHPTTRLCLELLQETLSAAPGARLLDVGCGSGALMLAGAAWGAQWCVGVDLSWRAVHTARENARLNGLAGAARLVQGSTECLRGPFGVVLANLPWAVQLGKVADLARLAGPQGYLILSGFKDTQEEELLGRYREAGWTRRRRRTRDEWVIDLPPDQSFTWVAWLLHAS